MVDEIMTGCGGDECACATKTMDCLCHCICDVCARNNGVKLQRAKERNDPSEQRKPHDDWDSWDTMNWVMGSDS